MRFSERYGHKKVRDAIQIDAIDEPLRNALWSLLKVHVWDHVHVSTGVYGGYFLSRNEEHRSLCERLWFNYFKKPLDNLDNDWTRVREQLRTYFFDCSWFEVYDFVEFVANNYRRYQFKEKFIDGCNAILEREMSAYRFVGDIISKITDEQEVKEIEEALELARGPVQTHLRRALDLLSDRETPDYRNSIKESISAVESLVSTAVGEKGTLGQLIKKLEDEHVHPALRAAFGNLYGYTSDAGGIRHALLESENVSFEDAKFFLVVCSAFVNFVLSKLE